MKDRFVREACAQFIKGAQKLAIEQKHRRVPSPSTIGDCFRRLWYQAHEVPRSNLPDGESYIVAETSRLSEIVLSDILIASGLVTSLEYDPRDEEARELSREELARGALAGGQVDNIGITPDDERVLIEYKRRPAVEILKLHEMGVKQAQPHHYYQLQALLHAKAMETAYYVVVSHSRREVSITSLAGKRFPVYIERVKYDPDLAQQLVKRAKTAWRYINKAKNAGSVPTESMSEHLNPNAVRFPCATQRDGILTPWCPYFTRCKNGG